MQEAEWAEINSISGVWNRFDFNRDEHIRLCFLHQENGTCEDCGYRRDKGCAAFPEYERNTSE